MKPRYLIAEIVAVVSLLGVTACSKLTSPPSPEPIASEVPAAAPKAPGAPASAANAAPPPPPVPTPAMPTLPPEAADAKLEIKDLTVGKGKEAKKGAKVRVHYTGKLVNGDVFDSSQVPGRDPIEFTLGAGNVIKGWDDGLLGMKVGGKRRLTIPSKQAYGDQGRPPKIPPKATLVFETELMGVN